MRLGVTRIKTNELGFSRLANPHAIGDEILKQILQAQKPENTSQILQAIMYGLTEIASRFQRIDPRFMVVPMSQEIPISLMVIPSASQGQPMDLTILPRLSISLLPLILDAQTLEQIKQLIRHQFGMEYNPNDVYLILGIAPNSLDEISRRILEKRKNMLEELARELDIQLEFIENPDKLFVYKISDNLEKFLTDEKYQQFINEMLDMFNVPKPIRVEEETNLTDLQNELLNKDKQGISKLKSKHE